MSDGAQAPASLTTLDVWLIELQPASRGLLDEPWPRNSACARLTAAVPRQTDVTVAEEIARVRRTTQLALRLLLARSIGVAAAMLPFEIGTAGKPRHPGGRPAFSLSHSGDRALIALISQGEVGVDIEAPRTIGMDERRQRMIRAAGIAAAGGSSLADGSANARTLQAWVRLEAIAKFQGDGMGRLLGRLGIIGGGTPEPITPETGGYRLEAITLDRGYVAAVAGPRQLWNLALHRFPSAHEQVAALMAEVPD